MKTVKNTTAKKVAKKVVVKKVSPMEQLLATLPTQKAKVVYFAEEGKTIDEIVEITGIRKINVAWYYSKLGYCKAAKAKLDGKIKAAKDAVSKSVKDNQSNPVKKVAKKVVQSINKTSDKIANKAIRPVAKKRALANIL